MYLFTSEVVSPGHPDKCADIIADSIVDTILTQDPNGRVASEVFRGEWVYIPRCETALRVLRNYRFKADFDYLTQHLNISGRMAMLELCPKYQLSDRSGWEIVAQVRNPKESSNFALF